MKRGPAPASAIGEFASRQAAVRLGMVAEQVARVIDTPGADEIHDLRVSIRRLNHALLAFMALMDGRAVRKVRKRLKRVMRLTSDTRNRDIALEFFDRQSLPARSRVRAAMVADRAACRDALLKELRRLTRREFAVRWGRKLGLGNV